MENNLIFEVGTEEVPARFMPAILKELAKKASEKLSEKRLSFSSVKTFGTPRRLVLYVENLALKQEDLAEEKKGPFKDAAFRDGKPTQAAIGFAKSCGIKIEKLFIKDFSGKPYVFAAVLHKGKPAAVILKDLLPEIISSLYLPVSMRWSDLDFKFIRPIHWLLASYGGKPVKCELAGIRSSNKTYGNRLLFPKAKVLTAAALKDINSYKKALLKLGVVLDQNERRERIKQKVVSAAGKIGAKAIISKNLLEEVNYLVELPEALVGSFDKRFLAIPQEVLTTSMKKNQKYFPLVSDEARPSLLNKFIVITNGVKSSGIINGNQKVLVARLSDAKFFFDEDRKTPLRERVHELKKVAFFGKLGTMHDKQERLKTLSLWIAKELKLEVDQPAIEKTSRLCKADLVTQMVYEFPVLQGVMGMEYARLEGENSLVSQGILEHYLPRFAGDKLPRSMEGSLLSMADKLDSIVGCFSIGLIPTGSADPYGLRRAAHGIVSIVLNKKLDLLLDEAIEKNYHLYSSILKAPRPVASVISSVRNFIAGRVKPLLLEEKIRHDVVDAVLANFNDVLDVFEKARVINSVVNTEKLKGVVTTADRVKRIAKPAEREIVIEQDFVQDEEKNLHQLYLKINWEVGEAIKKEDWKKALEQLAELTKPVDEFFVKVMVMHEDQKLRANRLALLKSIDDLYLQVADFSKVVI